MKVRVKTITLASIIIIAILAIACANLGNSHSSDNKTVAVKQFKQEYPHVFANAGYSKLLESSPVNQNKLTESAMQAQGKSTNPFGIRDDIFEYIVKNIPKDNESALYAALRHEQYRALLYQATNREEALYAVRTGNISIHCLINTMGLKPAVHLERAIHEIDISTKEGQAAYDRGNAFIGWQLIGPKQNLGELNKMCQTGEY